MEKIFKLAFVVFALIGLAFILRLTAPCKASEGCDSNPSYDPVVEGQW